MEAKRQEKKLGDLVVEMWRKLTDSEKAPWHRFSHLAREMHKEKWPEYKYKPKTKGGEEEDNASNGRKRTAKQKVKKEEACAEPAIYEHLPSTPVPSSTPLNGPQAAVYQPTPSHIVQRKNSLQLTSIDDTVMHNAIRQHSLGIQSALQCRPSSVPKATSETVTGPLNSASQEPRAFQFVAPYEGGRRRVLQNQTQPRFSPYPSLVRRVGNIDSGDLFGSYERRCAAVCLLFLGWLS